MRTADISRPVVLERYESLSGKKMRREAHMAGRKLVINRFCRGEGIVDSWCFDVDATNRLRRFLNMSDALRPRRTAKKGSAKP